MLLDGSSVSQAVCSGAVVGICVNMTCMRMGDTCTCMLCSASFLLSEALHSKHVHVFIIYSKCDITFPHTSSMNVLYWLEWARGMVGSLAAISGRDWVGLNQQMERIIKTIVLY